MGIIHSEPVHCALPFRSSSPELEGYRIKHKMIVPIILPRIKQAAIIQSSIINPENMSGLVVVTHRASQGRIVHVIRPAQRSWEDVI
jgi:hypothetical protein